jgi:hypothetical protein
LSLGKETTKGDSSHAFPPADEVPTTTAIPVDNVHLVDMDVVILEDLPVVDPQAILTIAPSRDDDVMV